MIEDSIVIGLALDSLANAPQAIPVFPNDVQNSTFQSVLDVICKIATVLIAAFNACFAYAIFKLKDKYFDIYTIVGQGACTYIEECIGNENAILL